MTVEIPEELETQLGRVTQDWIRGLRTQGEATLGLKAAVFRQVTHERRKGRDEAVYPESRRTDLIVSITKAHNVPRGFLALACRVCPPGTDAIIDAIVYDSLTRMTTPPHLDEESLELAEAWLSRGGETPPNLLSVTVDATPLSTHSWLKYLISRNASDEAAQWQIVAADAAAGCPGSLLFHLENQQASENEIRRALRLVDIQVLQIDARWGDLASVALFLAERGWHDWSRKWSGAILTNRVLTSWTGGQQHHPVHGKVCANNDTSVFSALALINVLSDRPTF